MQVPSARRSYLAFRLQRSMLLLDAAPQVFVLAEINAGLTIISLPFWRTSAGVSSLLRLTAYPMPLVNFGADSPEDKYYNKRAYMWGKLKDWLLAGAIDDDPRLECDL